MDLLKKAQRSINDVVLEDDNRVVIIDSKKYDGELVVEMPSDKCKRYTLASLIYFLKNETLSYADYVTQCQREKIPPVGYLDQSLVKKELQEYRGVEVRGSFDEMTYTSNKKYDIPPLDSQYYIVVSGSVLSPINSSNAPIILSMGRNEDGELPSKSSNPREIIMDGNTFIITGDPGGLRETDWPRVKAVFTDGKDGSIGPWERSLQKNIDNIPVFTTGTAPDYAQRIQVNGNTIENLDSIWETILRNVHT